MSEQHSAFIGTIPENYDRYLGPLFMERSAKELVKRLKGDEGKTVLELACGTGILTRELRAALKPDAQLLATDLNPDMLKYAEKKLGTPGNVEWKQANMMALPFADASFSAVVCQYGVMFPPDKLLAMRETYRVLAPGGVFLFNVWDSMAHNDFARIAQGVVDAAFDQNPPDFYYTPFGFYDRVQMRTWLEQAGFQEITDEFVPMDIAGVSAQDAARGFIRGNPIALALQERHSDVVQVEDIVERAFAQELGDHPVRGKMLAQIWRAVRKG